MSARDDLRKYVSLLADWWTPREKTDARVERLYEAVRAEVLREAAQKIRTARPVLLVRRPESPNAVALAMQSVLADLIDPDKDAE